MLAIEWRGFFPDRMMMVAERALGGHLDSKRHCWYGGAS